MSTTRESQPAWAITSAEKLLGMPHQLLITGFPAAHNSRTRLARAIGSSSCSARTRPIPPAGAGEVKDLSSAGLVPGLVEHFLVDDVVAERLAVEHAQNILHGDNT